VNITGRRTHALATLLLTLAPAACGGGGATDSPDAAPATVDAGAVDAVPLLELGAACDAASACLSGFCADGVCCDAACDGACEACGPAGACGPADEGTTCRAAAGPCDVVETCDGASAACPVDGFVSAASEVVCREAQGGCDATELCTGTEAACPPDELIAEGNECRAAGGSCGLAETCTGVDVDCPLDEVEPAGTGCGAYRCTGDSDVCPTSCASTEDCNVGLTCVDGACTQAKWVFATSTRQVGNLGGLAGADAICQARATAAGLGGTYRAWLADASGSPSTRFVQANVPYLMPVAGASAIKIADSYADLVDGSLDHAIDHDELGASVTGFTYTNVFPAGTHISAAQSCVGWTSGSVNDTGGLGSTTAATTAWTNSGGGSCNTMARLFCFEQ